MRLQALSEITVCAPRRSLEPRHTATVEEDLDCGDGITDQQLERLWTDDQAKQERGESDHSYTRLRPS